jgi:hypothetical protein
LDQIDRADQEQSRGTELHAVETGERWRIRLTFRLPLIPISVSYATRRLRPHFGVRPLPIKKRHT